MSRQSPNPVWVGENNPFVTPTRTAQSPVPSVAPGNMSIPPPFPQLWSPGHYAGWYNQQPPTNVQGWDTPTHQYPQRHHQYVYDQMNAQGWSTVKDQQRIQALEQQVYQLQLQLQQAMQGQPQVTQNLGSSIRAMKVSNPETFEGGSTEKFQVWLTGINLYFGAHKNVTDEEKIICALSYLRGKAAESAKLYSTKAGAGQPLGTWAEFVQKLNSIYGLRNETQHARQSLHHLQQTGSVVEYATTFKELVSHIPNMHDEDQQYFFKLGLKYDVGRHLATNNTTRAAKNVEDLIVAAVQYEEDMATVKKVSPPNTTPKPKFPQAGRTLYQPKQEAGHSHKDPNAMEIDGNRFAHFTCYRCQDKGHLARDCKNPPKPRVFKPHYTPKQPTIKATHMDPEEAEAKAKDAEEAVYKELHAKFQSEFEEKMEKAMKQLGF